MEGPGPDLHDWIMSINEDLGKMESVTRNKPKLPRARGIARLPPYLRERLPPDYWEPRHLRLGPYHASNEYSPWKRRVFLYFLKRSNQPLNVYVEALRDIVQDLKDAYDELDPEPWLQDDHAFLLLMIQDGCVLVETLRELADFNLTRYFGWDYDNWGHPLWDVVDEINRRDLFEYYKHNLLLLENQLPMVLLVRLMAVQTDESFQVALDEICSYLSWTFKPFAWLHRGDDSRMCLHLLDLYRCDLVGEIHIDRRGRWIPTFNVNIPSATDLKDAGIRITMSRTTSLMDISIRHGKLMLPQIFFDGAAKSRFINIIAFEQLHEYTNEVTSYVYLMSGLLRNANDVRILRSSGIILTGLCNDEIVEMFNKLTEELIMRDPLTFLIPEYKEVVRSLVGTFKVKQWKMDLWQKYLVSPWAIVSLVVALVVFVLTLSQAVYTVLDYYNSR